MQSLGTMLECLTTLLPASQRSSLAWDYSIIHPFTLSVGGHGILSCQPSHLPQECACEFKVHDSLSVNPYLGCLFMNTMLMLLKQI